MVSLEVIMLRLFWSGGTIDQDGIVAKVLICVHSSFFRMCILDFDIRTRGHDLDSSYGCSRFDLINTLSGKAMQQCSNIWSLPHSPEFKITLPDNDATFDKDWWTTQITRNLPVLKKSLTMCVHIGMLDAILLRVGALTS